MPADALVVELKSGGDDPKVAVNTKEMSYRDLRAFLAGVLSQRPADARGVYVKAPNDALFDDVAGVMLQIEAASADVLFLMIEDGDPPREIGRVAPRPPTPGGVPGGMPGGVPGGEVPPPPPVFERWSSAQMMRAATRRVEVTQPQLAETAGIEGNVVVEVTLDESGDVETARAISGHPLLRDAAVRTAREWKFAPPRRQGRPIKVIGRLTITFKRA
jgi:TonB family protein